MKDGIHAISMADYLRDPAVNQSSLKRIAQSPAHFRHYVDNPPESTRAQILGTALHTAILQPELLEESHWIRPETYERKGEIKKWSGNAVECRDWLYAHEDRPVLRQDEHDTILAMRMYVFDHPAANLALGKGLSEQSLFVTDPETGTQLKCRLDRLSGNTVVELKSCEDASPLGFAKAVANFGYEIQAAYGLDIANHLSLKKDHWIFVCVEKEPPYAVGVYQLDEESIACGRSKYRRLLNRYLECVVADKWPAYSSNVEFLKLPKWALSQEFNALLLEDQPQMPALEVV